MGRRLVKNNKEYLRIREDEREIVEKVFDTLVVEEIDDEYVKESLIKNKDNMVDNVIVVVDSLKTTKEEVLKRMNKTMIEFSRYNMLQNAKVHFNCNFDEDLFMNICDEYIAKEQIVFETLSCFLEQMMIVTSILKSNGEKLEDICNIKIPNNKKAKKTKKVKVATR